MRHFLSILISFLLVARNIEGSKVSASNSYLSGPGLDPQAIVLPCRYFNIYLKSKENVSIDLNDKSQLKVEIVGQSLVSHREAPVRYDMFHVEQGTHLVRYKLYSTQSHLKISVTIKSEHVQGSPVTVQGQPVQPSDCSCPRDNFHHWLRDFKCPQQFRQIMEDLEAFGDDIDMKAALNNAEKRFNQRRSQSFCHYVIKENQIYRNCFGEHVGFKMFPDAAFSYLSRIVRLPDTEFLINLGDWPLIHKHASPPIPMISWCKTNQTLDILLPTYEITEASLECMGRQTLDMLSVSGKTHMDWNKKIDKAFFKGRDSSKERLKLARMSKDKPDFLEAGITRYFFFKDMEKSLGSVPYTSFFDFFKYKYQVNMDGTVAAYRFPFLLAGGSLIFKQHSEYFEHFYKELQSGYHYIDMEEDAKDLLKHIEWSRLNDEKSEEIAKNGRKFAQENLMPHQIFCYHVLFLQEWTKRLRHPVEVQPNMEKVETDKDNQNFCSCNKASNKAKDEF